MSRYDRRRPQSDHLPRRQLRLLTTGALTLATACGAVLLGATAASAHANAVSGTVSCVTSGSTPSYAITWTISNNWPVAEEATVASVTPAGSQVTPTLV